MPAPVVSKNATDALVALGPWGRADGDGTGWSLLHFLEAMLGDGQLQDVTDWASDDPVTGMPGWANWLDPTLAPAIALPWLAQFVGVTLIIGDTEAGQRSTILRMQGFQRGTPDAMIAAAQATLTGTQAVVLFERDPDAYTLKVVTYAAETPVPANTLAALLTQKPAGIILNYVIQSGTSWGGYTLTWGDHPETWGSLSDEVGG